MKKLSFAAGVLTMALIGGLGFSALAATGQVSFNISALSLNGTQVSAKGENYTLANGQSVPASITYTDEKGGGTTYLPVRRISELLGVETGWDGAAGSVTVKGEVKAPETTTPPTDYSDWSKEDEAAYQEFKGYFDISALELQDPTIPLYSLRIDFSGSKDELNSIVNAKALARRMLDEGCANIGDSIGGKYVAQIIIYCQSGNELVRYGKIIYDNVYANSTYEYTGFN